MSEKKSETVDSTIRYYKGKKYDLIEGKSEIPTYTRLVNNSTRQEILAPSKDVYTEEEFQKRLNGPHPYHVTW